MTQFVVISGQSVAMGTQGMEGGDMSLNNRVFVWTGTANGWQVADPANPPFNTSGGVYNNPGWQAAKALQESTGENVYFVLSGHGGQPISEWNNGEEQWTDLNRAINRAMETPELAGKTKADYFYWIQGEADRNNENYAADLLDLRDRAIVKGWIDANTTITAHETVMDGQSKEAVLNLIASGENPWLRLAYNDGVEYVGYHPKGSSCDEFGQSIFNASRAPTNELTGKWDYDHFVFGTEQRNTFTIEGNTRVISGDAGDTVYSTGEGSMIQMGKGNDFVFVDDFGPMRIYGGNGNDTVHLYLSEGEDYSMVRMFSVETVEFHYV